MRKTIIFILTVSSVIFCCKKEDSSTVYQLNEQLYYRLALVRSGGDTSYSQIITAKAQLSELSTDDKGNGQCKNNAGHDNCNCDEKSPEFCAKHPCHWKCRLLGSTILEYFQVRVQSNKPTIFWATTDESQIQSIVLSRSTDSKNFKNIYQVKSNQIPKRYQYTDK